ncbi:MAG TPA: Crp/Fnr family transcriptional regulator [Candidatus Angelobacter sp.]|jgi:CRP-like cAMP-binding protein
MPAATESRTHKNRILASLPKVEIGRLAPYLSPLTFEIGKTLVEPGEEITHAYFLESGMASVVVAMADGNTVETGITGNDGVVGIPILLGTKSMPTRTFIQIAGSGYRIAARRLAEAYEKPGMLRKQINRYFQAHLAQTAQTAACNRLHDIEERLARWLLICHDRMESDTFALTHEFLGHMLGTPRTTVTLAAGQLHKAELVDYSRGKVRIRNRQGLENAACECYKTIRDEFERLGISSNNV